MSEIRKLSKTRTAAWLAIEIIAVVLVVMCFRFIGDRLLAARVASSLFLLVNLGLIWDFHPFRRKIWTLTFVFAVFFLLAFSLPMGAYRIFTDAPFYELDWFGLSGPELHQYSSEFYKLLVLGTFVDLIRLKFLKA